MSTDTPIGPGSPWQQARAEWQANARLRLGVFAILGILWLWGLLVLQDQTAAWTTRPTLRARKSTACALADRDALDPARSGRAQVLEAAESMVWTAGSQGSWRPTCRTCSKQWSESWTQHP